MKILVIVVTFNGKRWLDRCLGSVFASKVPADAYVADNASSDGSADYVQEHFPKAILQRNKSNLGFAKGNNQGFRYALKNGYDFVYLLNQDAWIEPDTLERLAALSEKYPDFAILSPMQMQDGSEKLNPIFERDVLPRMKPCDVSEGLYEVPFVMAAHWFMPIGAIMRVGLFSELFPIFGNDDNYCHRVLFHGYKIGVVKEMSVVHDKQYSAPDKEYKLYRNYYMSSLVALADIRKPLWLQWLHVLALTVVKMMKYASFKPWRYLFKMMGSDAQAVKKLRKISSRYYF